MSVDYDLVCHSHSEKVSICCDGMSGPMINGCKSVAAFCITHRDCDLNIIDEHNEDCDDYSVWYDENWKVRLSYKNN
jgi:hypothetical protein